MGIFVFQYITHKFQKNKLDCSLSFGVCTPNSTKDHSICNIFTFVSACFESILGESECCQNYFPKKKKKGYLVGNESNGRWLNFMCKPAQVKENNQTKRCNLCECIGKIFPY